MIKTLTIRRQVDVIVQNSQKEQEKLQALKKLAEKETAKTWNLADAGYRLKKINLIRTIIYNEMTKCLTNKYTTQ